MKIAIISLFVGGAVCVGVRHSTPRESGAPRAEINLTPEASPAAELPALELPEAALTIDEAIRDTAPAYGVPLEIAFAVKEKESAGRHGVQRFEPGQMDRARRVAPRKDLATVKKYATSRCELQIMGYNAAAYGYDPDELEDPRVCAEIAMAMLAKCRERAVKKEGVRETWRQWHRAGVCYNGSVEYADDMMKKAGRIALERSIG